MQHVPRRPNGGPAVCLDYNAHSGCVRGASCKFAHDYLGRKNLHRCVGAELIRRGGFRKRRNMIRDQVEANVLIDDMRLKNQKSFGGKPLPGVTPCG